MSAKQNTSVRLDSVQKERLDRIARAESERTGYEVTSSAALRRALDKGLSALESELGIDNGARPSKKGGGT